MSEAEIQLLKQISESLAHLNSRMETNEAISRQTLERLVRLEERTAAGAKVDERIDKVEGLLTARLNGHSDRIAALEARGHRLDGASSAVEWANKLWPLFAATIGLVGIYLGLIST